MSYLSLAKQRYDEYVTRCEWYGTEPMKWEEFLNKYYEFNEEE